MSNLQHTLAKSVTLSGTGLHSGETVTMTLQPAESFTGIVFHRSDVEAGAGAINICADSVHDTRLCSTVANDHGVTVGTVEHLMAAFYALGVDNVIVELDGPEVPILDGSAGPFLETIDRAGLVAQTDARKAIKVLKEVTVKDGNRAVSVKPAPSFALHVFVDYGRAAPPQKDDFDGSELEFRRRLAEARTFCLEKDIDAMKAAGLAKGGSLENALVLRDDGPLNPEGLRQKDEVLCHKALDCLGDFYMAGYRIIGAFNATRPGHELNNQLLRTLLADKSNWKWV